jgi:hypothetical protein
MMILSDGTFIPEFLPWIEITRNIETVFKQLSQREL